MYCKRQYKLQVEKEVEQKWKKRSLLTQEGYEKLEKELEYLVTEKRKGEIADRIKVALDLEIYLKI